MPGPPLAYAKAGPVCRGSGSGEGATAVACVRLCSTTVVSGGSYVASRRRSLERVDDRLAVTVDWGGMQGADAMVKLLSQPEPSTAVYAHSDEVALGASALHRFRRRAGGAIQIGWSPSLGWDNDHASSGRGCPD